MRDHVFRRFGYAHDAVRRDRNRDRENRMAFTYSLKYRRHTTLNGLQGPGREPNA